MILFIIKQIALKLNYDKYSICLKNVEINNLYLKKKAQYSILENYTDLNLKIFFCKKPDLSNSDEKARYYMDTEERIPQCEDIENFVTLLIENSNEDYVIKLNVTSILIKHNLTENKLYCKLNLFDKTYKISEYYNPIFISETKFEKKLNHTIVFSKHGFYYLSCYKRANKTDILIYEDTYYILPHNISKLVDEKNVFKNTFL